MTAAMKLKDTPWKESFDQPRQHIKKQRHHFTNKGLSSQGFGFFSSLVWMWELGYKESWAPKNWCFWTVVLEKTLESPLDSKEVQPVHPKGNQSWIFIRRTDAEAETPILWPPDAKNWLIWKDPDAGKDWRWEEKGMTEDEMVEWHHRLDGHEFEQALGVGDGQGSLVCYSQWGRKELDRTERLNWTEGQGPNLIGLVSLQAPSLASPQCLHQGKARWGWNQKIALCKPGRVTPETKSGAPWSWNFSLQNFKE